ncbi:polysaccharide deacetylase family protein [Hoeflea sp. YIM 152468]|uniref:polysaccharide deacetylase family protein n=1 Tax=Hoeflea sp. YIM 152468 TaxID=3031759 RepID=UPI0023DACA8F|nr:polysaccharide deacetylase family protein [Hoeflea sp. YIM 152468]MDF1608581.1 polysaccharide deacetylase family protein [Hoeflea sp. YIM 152468]
MFGPSTIAARRLLKRTVIQGGLEAVSLMSKAGVMQNAGGMGAIFTLHHVRPAVHKDFDPVAHLTITPDFLDASITRLKADGRVPVALEDLPDFLAQPDQPGPAMVFTLDDGYRDNDQHARPVFEKHGIPYTVFVSGGFVDRTHSIWWETAEQLISAVNEFTFDFGNGEVTLPTGSLIEKYAAFDRLHKALACAEQDMIVSRLDAQARTAGICPLGIVDHEVMNERELSALAATPLASLGAHTISHINLAHVDTARMHAEIEQSAERVARIAGARPQTLAYPYGDSCAAGPREFETARELGFKLAVTTNPGVLNSESLSDLHSLHRISLNGYYQKTRYVEALVSGIPFARR